MMERSSMMDSTCCWLIPLRCSPKSFFIRTAVWRDIFLRHFLLEVLIDMMRLTRRLTDHNSAGEAAAWKADKNSRKDSARSHLTLCWTTDQQIIPSFSMSCFFCLLHHRLSFISNHLCTNKSIAISTIGPGDQQKHVNNTTQIPVLTLPGFS